MALYHAPIPRKRSGNNNSCGQCADGVGILSLPTYFLILIFMHALTSQFFNRPQSTTLICKVSYDATEIHSLQLSSSDPHPQSSLLINLSAATYLYLGHLQVSIFPGVIIHALDLSFAWCSAYNRLFSSDPPHSLAQAATISKSQFEAFIKIPPRFP